MKKQSLGMLGEKLACSYLKKKNYRIIEKNYRCSCGEIDIIALKNNALRFIEVRAKSSDTYGSPEESITCAKQERLVASALHYVSNHEKLPENWHIDFVAVEIDPLKGKAKRIELIENVVD